MSLGDHVLKEAESIVHSWYKRGGIESDNRPVSKPVTSTMDDVITSAFHQANHGNVSEAVEQIMNGLRSLPIEDKVMADVQKYWENKNRDPRIGIEKRQQELRENKRLREERGRDKAERKKRKSEAMRESGISEKRDSTKAEYHKRRIAEAVLHHQVNSFRNEVRRETSNRREELTSYYTARIQSSGSAVQSAVRTPESIREAESIVRGSTCEDTTESPLIITCAEQLISARESAVKLSHTRRVLIAQLEEASHLEAKENLKLIHRIFNCWHSLAVENRILLANARTVEEWRCLCRAFSAWKGFVARLREAKLRDTVSEKLIHERQTDTIAVEHFSCRIVRKCFVSWKIWARNTGELRRHADKIREKRIKIAVFLDAAEKGKITQEENKMFEKRKLKAHPLDIPINVGDLYDKKIDIITTKSVKEKLNPKPEKKKIEKKLENPLPKSTSATMDVVAKEVTNIPKLISIIIPDVVSNVPPTPLYVPPEPPAPLSHPKKFTIPFPLTQMEERNAVIIRRKREREERRRLLEEEKATRELELETERIRKEEELKRIEIVKRQDEKRAARIREIENETAREKAAIQTRSAVAHYQKYLLRKYCFGALVKYRVIQARKYARADTIFRISVQREFFPIWREALKLREQQKIAKADTQLNIFRIRRVWYKWRVYIQHCSEYNNLATELFNRNVLMKCLEAWKVYRHNEFILKLNRQIEADRLYNRFLLVRAFRCVKHFIPALIEEREREIRLEDLREQVREIFPDFGKYKDLDV